MVKIKAEEHSEMDPQGSIGIILKYQRWLTNYVLPTQQLPTPRSFAASEVQRIIWLERIASEPVIYTVKIHAEIF